MAAQDRTRENAVRMGDEAGSRVALKETPDLLPSIGRRDADSSQEVQSPMQAPLSEISIALISMAFTAFSSGPRYHAGASIPWLRGLPATPSPPDWG
jgi:hypothetical protein